MPGVWTTIDGNEACARVAYPLRTPERENYAFFLEFGLGLRLAIDQHEAQATRLRRRLAPPLPTALVDAAALVDRARHQIARRLALYGELAKHAERAGG